MKFLDKIRNYTRISGFAPIGRRYFIKNAFDGAMTSLGIVVGAYVAGDPEPFFIISLIIAAIISLVISGIVGKLVRRKVDN